MRTLIAVGLLVLTTAPLDGQAMAVKAGVAFSSLTSEESGVDRTSGIQIGADFSVPLGGLEFRPGVAYVPKGASVSAGGAVADISLGFIQFSGLFRIPSNRGPTSVGVMLGPWVGLRTSCGIAVQTGDTRVAEDCNQPIDSMDAGLAGGGGAVFSISPNLAIVADIIYHVGLVSLTDADEKTRSVSILAGIQIGW